MFWLSFHAWSSFWAANCTRKNGIVVLLVFSPERGSADNDLKKRPYRDLEECEQQSAL